MSVRIGLGPVTGQVPPGSGRSVADEYAEILGLARLAEACGFDSFWVSEHHGAADGYLPSLLVMLGAVAAVTHRLGLGTAVALGPFQHPLRFAEDCAVVDQLARGRLQVGLGAGWRREEFASFGIPTDERIGRTAELVRICRSAWAGGRFTFRGRYFSYDDVAVTPTPFGRIPLLLAGNVPAAAERAGRSGDGYLATPHDRIADFRRQIALFDRAARDAGRDPARLKIGFHVNAWVSPDGGLPARVRDALWHGIGTYQLWHARDAGGAATALPPLDEALIRARTIAGTPAEVVVALRPWIEEFGGRELEVIVRLHHPGLRLAEVEPAVRAFGAEVIPALRGLAPVTA